MTKATMSFLVLSMVVVYTLTMANLSNSQVLLQTGFEEDKIGKMPQEPADTWKASGGGFEVSDSNAKVGKQSLELLGGAGNNGLSATLIETQSQVVTVEFWLYIEGVERSLTFFMKDAVSGLTNWTASGPYLNWIGEKMRYCCGWTEITPMASDKWHYVRIVVDTGNSVYDVYVADTTAEAHAGEPVGKNLPFRAAITPSRVCFSVYEVASIAYIDELLVYEGNVLPKGIIMPAVKPEGKLALTWGKVKEQ